MVADFGGQIVNRFVNAMDRPFATPKQAVNRVSKAGLEETAQ